MGLRELEKGITEELRLVLNNPKVTKHWVQEWSTDPDVVPQEGETKVYLPLLGVYVCYKEPNFGAKSTK